MTILSINTLSFLNNDKVYVYSPNIPVGSAHFAFITPMYWNSLVSPGEKATEFSATVNCPETQCIPVIKDGGQH